MKKITVSVINTAAIGQRCGYGEGSTWEAAVADALKKYPGAYFCEQTKTVCIEKLVSL